MATNEQTQRNGQPPDDADERWSAGPCDLAHGVDDNTAYIGQGWTTGDGRPAMEWRYPCGCVKAWIQKDGVRFEDGSWVAYVRGTVVASGPDEAIIRAARKVMA